ncbi:MAG: putative quinol monooxygenase [Rhodopirellula sp. JB044]|uniref:putative quinol monooxygenase n=1 Tax=Rhodopirellula sp. JB044 TaxID=3342844 RepID=UPI00370AEFED
MPQLTITANITAKPDQIDLVKAELHKVVAPTRAEEGCVRYDFHEDNDNPAHFFFYETWESRDLWQAHMNSKHLQDFVAATEGALEELKIHEMTLVE